MPQMSPMSWLLLFVTFSITFILFNIMNYYCFLPTSPKSTLSTKIENNKMNWKW